MTAPFDPLTRHRASEAPFLSDQGSVYTFRDVDALVDRRAAEFGPHLDGAVVAVAPQNDVASVVDVLALWRAGVAVQLLNVRATESERDLQVARTGALRLSDGSFFTRTEGLQTADDLQPAGGGRPALIMSTSGTSGQPRLVVLTAANLLASADASIRHMRQRTDDRWLTVLPLFHIAGISIVVRSALAGSEVVLRDRFDGSRTAHDLEAVTLASLVGSMLPPILSAGFAGSRGLRGVLVGGGPTSERVLIDAAGAGIPVLSTYGMTETASQIAAAPLGDGPRRRVVALPGAEIRISADGEIEVRGAMVAPGYVGGPWREPHRWFATGDLGTLDEQGYLRVHGRRSDLIITGGENVMPAEVEAAIRAVDDVAEVAVVGTPSDEWGEAIVAVIATARSVRDIEDRVRATLAGFKVPKRWVVVDALPRTPLGKVDRTAVRRLAAS